MTDDDEPEPVDVDLYFTLRQRLRLPAWAALAVARSLDDDAIDLIYEEEGIAADRPAW